MCSYDCVVYRVQHRPARLAVIENYFDPASFHAAEEPSRSLNCDFSDSIDADNFATAVEDVLVYEEAIVSSMCETNDTKEQGTSHGKT